MSEAVSPGPRRPTHGLAGGDELLQPRSLDASARIEHQHHRDVASRRRHVDALADAVVQHLEISGAEPLDRTAARGDEGVEAHAIDGHAEDGLLLKERRPADGDEREQQGRHPSASHCRTHPVIPLKQGFRLPELGAAIQEPGINRGLARFLGVAEDAARVRPTLARLSSHHEQVAEGEVGRLALGVDGDRLLVRRAGRIELAAPLEELAEEERREVRRERVLGGRRVREGLLQLLPCLRDVIDLVQDATRRRRASTRPGSSETARRSHFSASRRSSPTMPREVTSPAAARKGPHERLGRRTGGKQELRVVAKRTLACTDDHRRIRVVPAGAPQRHHDDVPVAAEGTQAGIRRHVRSPRERCHETERGGEIRPVGNGRLVAAAERPARDGRHRVHQRQRGKVGRRRIGWKRGLARHAFCVPLQELGHRRGGVAPAICGHERFDGAGGALLTGVDEAAEATAFGVSSMRGGGGVAAGQRGRHDHRAEAGGDNQGDPEALDGSRGHGVPGL